MSKATKAFLCLAILGVIVGAGFAYRHYRGRPRSLPPSDSGALSSGYREKAVRAVEKIHFFVMADGAGIDEAENAVADASKSRANRQDEVLQTDLQREMEADRRLVKIRLRVGILSDQMALAADNPSARKNLQAQFDTLEDSLRQADDLANACTRIVAFRLGSYPELEAADQNLCSSVEAADLP